MEWYNVLSVLDTKPDDSASPTPVQSVIAAVAVVTLIRMPSVQLPGVISTGGKGGCQVLKTRAVIRSYRGSAWPLELVMTITLFSSVLIFIPSTLATVCQFLVRSFSLPFDAFFSKPKLHIGLPPIEIEM